MTNQSQSSRVPQGMLPAIGVDRTTVIVLAAICITAFLVLSGLGTEPAKVPGSTRETRTDETSVFTESELLGADLDLRD